MTEWMKKIIFRLVLSFVLRQIAKFRDKTDWATIEKDLDDRVRQLLPGTWFDDEAVLVVKSLIQCIKCSLGETDKIKDVITFATEEKWGEAFGVVKDSMATYLQDRPQSMAEVNVKKMFQDSQFC